MARSIEIIVRPDGSLNIDAVGFQGTDCAKATRFLEQALGNVASKQKKPEIYRRVQRRQQIGT